jgi:hypothetical protein
MNEKSSLTLVIARPDGSETIYCGEAEGFLDPVAMRLVSGQPLPGYDPDAPNSLQFHAALCRAAAWDQGLETKECWEEPFSR